MSDINDEDAFIPIGSASAMFPDLNPSNIVGTILITRREVDGKTINDVYVDGGVHAVNVPDDMIVNVIRNISPAPPAADTTTEDVVYDMCDGDGEEDD